MQCSCEQRGIHSRFRIENREVRLLFVRQSVMFENNIKVELEVDYGVMDHKDIVCWDFVNMTLKAWVPQTQDIS
jgi:hypothetical protein